MQPAKAVVGVRVRTLVSWSGVAAGTEGVIDQQYGDEVMGPEGGAVQGVMVAWDLPERRLPEGYREYDGRPAIASGILRDGFAFDELHYLEVVT